MKLGLTFIAALLAKSATPSLAKGTRRVYDAAAEAAPAEADQMQAGLDIGIVLDQFIWDLTEIKDEYNTCSGDHSGADVAENKIRGFLIVGGSCEAATMWKVQMAYLQFAFAIAAKYPLGVWGP